MSLCITVPRNCWCFTWGRWLERTPLVADGLLAGKYFMYRLREGSGFLKGAHTSFDLPTSDNYDPARCGAFADWLDENKERLLEPHTDLRAEAEERLDSLIKWLRSGLQISA